MRPIICICNDPNTSSLAKLKLHANHIRLQQPAGTHIVKRLREVAENEDLRIDSGALTTLVGLAKGDLRSCLNTLQFVQSKGCEVTEEVIRRATFGMKENDTSLNSVLTSLFIPMSKKRVKELAMSEEEEGRYVLRLGQEIDRCGKENSIAIGCFGHYATLQHHDANFSRYQKAIDWLLTFDTLNTTMYNHGDFALSSYLPYTLIPFFPLFQQRGTPRVERYQADWENLQATQANEEILKTLSRSLTHAGVHSGGDFRHLLCAPVLQLEFVSFINRILSPPLQPVNSQIIRKEEKAILTRIVDIMASLELRFCQERAENGQQFYHLDPPIDVFITYDGKRAADAGNLRYATRHLVATEIEAKLIARNAEITKKEKLDKKTSGTSSLSREGEMDKSVLNGPSAKRLKVGETENLKPVDFFGREISLPLTDNKSRARNAGGGNNTRVTYRFKEGNSSAIRKPIKFDAFL